MAKKIGKATIEIEFVFKSYRRFDYLEKMQNRIDEWWIIRNTSSLIDIHVGLDVFNSGDKLHIEDLSGDLSGRIAMVK